MFNKFRGPFFGQRPRGQVIINPTQGNSGDNFFINVSEFTPLTRVWIFFYSPKNEIIGKGEYEVDDNGNLAGGYVKLETVGLPLGKYSIVAKGFYNKVESTASRTFEIK